MYHIISQGSLRFIDMNNRSKTNQKKRNTKTIRTYSYSWYTSNFSGIAASTQFVSLHQSICWWRLKQTPHEANQRTESQTPHFLTLQNNTRPHKLSGGNLQQRARGCVICETLPVCIRCSQALQKSRGAPICSAEFDVMGICIDMGICIGSRA